MPSLPPLPSFLASPLPAPTKRTPKPRRQKPGPKKGWKQRKNSQPIPTVQPTQNLSDRTELQRPSSPLNSAKPLTVSAAASAEVPPSAPSTGVAPPQAQPGGAGVQDTGRPLDRDKSPLEVENLQCSADELVSTAAVESVTAAPVEAVTGVQMSTSPYREVEGKEGNCQASSEANTCKYVEGVVGIGCRNKWYVEVCVDGVWGKCAKGGMSLWPGEVVKVRKVWESADGRDVEWEVVERVERVADEGLLVKPSGFAGGSANSPEAMAAPVKVEVAPEQPEVPYVPSGKDEQGDFLERARAEATRWAMGVA